MDPVAVRKWTDATPFEKHFPSATSVLNVVESFLVKGLDGVYQYLRSDDDWVVEMEPQYRRARGHKGIGVYGMCHKLDERTDLDNPLNDTCRVVSALEQAGYKAILWDMRKECQRKSGSDEHHDQCKPLNSRNQNALLCLATALEVAVALRYYDVEIVSALTFSKVWTLPEGWKLLCELVPKLATVPHVHVAEHLGWLGKIDQFNKNVSAAKIERSTQSFWWLSQKLSRKNVLPLSAEEIYEGF